MNRLPVSLRAIVTIGLVVVLGAATYWGVLAPKRREARNLRAELAAQAPPLWSLQPGSVTPVTEDERRMWAALEERLRGRFPSEALLPKALAAIANLAKESGLEIITLEVQRPLPAPPADPGKPAPPPPVPPPSGLTANPSTIKLTARHAYGDLVEFLEGLGRAPVYISVQSLEVKRLAGQLTSEATLASLRWGK